MIKSILSKFKSPRHKSEAFRDTQIGCEYRRTLRETIIPHNYRQTSTPAASCGEGELLKKRTERGYVVGSGINTDQPTCDGMAPALMGFLNSMSYGGKGAFALELTSVNR